MRLENLNQIKVSERVIYIFNKNRDLFIHHVRVRLDRRMFSDIHVEAFVDEMLAWVIMSKQNKVGFNDDTHIIKYFKHAFNNRARIEFFIKRNQMLDEIPLTDDERISNYELTLSIINKARPL